MRFYHLPTTFSFAALIVGQSNAQTANASTDLSWRAPLSSEINDLSSAINGSGTYGFSFNSSTLPRGVPYGTYNWCNMPHTRPQEYPRANSSFKLRYVEVIHRHHKRTPYAANTFPHETYPWYCNDSALFYSASPLPRTTNHSASTYWSVYTSSSNPLAPAGFNGTCQFPQITRGGLDDSHQHGLDLFSVYHGLLNFIPAEYDPSLVEFRVTNNVITSQVASMVIGAMYPSSSSSIPLMIQPASIDSLEPAYSCPSATALFASYTTGSNATTDFWQQHLLASQPLFSALDEISGVSTTDSGWHRSWDHYYDNLSSRLCHALPLPCSSSSYSTTNSSDTETETETCVSLTQAEEVFRLGQWEYSRIYRDDKDSLAASTASYGIWIAELAQHLRDVVDGKGLRYRHNVAHDGSLSRLLSILQVETMVWPGMGAEVVVELFEGVGEKEDKGMQEKWFVRVLWGGRVLRSSSPSLGVMDMVPLGRVLEYFDGLFGVGAEKVPGLCGI